MVKLDSLIIRWAFLIFSTRSIYDFVVIYRRAPSIKSICSLRTVVTILLTTNTQTPETIYILIMCIGEDHFYQEIPPIEISPQPLATEEPRSDFERVRSFLRHLPHVLRLHEDATFTPHQQMSRYMFLRQQQTLVFRHFVANARREQRRQWREKRRLKRQLTRRRRKSCWLRTKYFCAKLRRFHAMWCRQWGQI